MDLAEARTRLYGLAPESFLAHRIALVAEARAAKDRDLAKQIGQLRRPTRTAWLLNLLSRNNPDRLGELLALRDSLAQAQREGDGVQLRALSAQRRKLIDDLTRLALGLGEDAGYSAPDSAIPELGQTLHAAVADREIRDSLLVGVLTKAARYGGFGIELPTHTEPGARAESDDLMALMAASLPKDPPLSPPIASASTGSPAPDPGEDAVGAQRERRVEQRRRSEAERSERDQRAERERLEASRVEAQAAAAHAEIEAAGATTEADALAERVGSLREELSTAEASAKSADETARRARVAARTLRKQANDSEVAATAGTV